MASSSAADSRHSSDTNVICVICNLAIAKKAVIRLSQKGCDSINKAGVERGESVFATLGQAVHKLCRQNFINRKFILLQKKKTPPSPRKQKTQTRRSSGTFFNYEKHCLFCGRPEEFKGFKTVEKLKNVLTKNKFQNSVENICRERGDEWSTGVLARIEYITDCRAGDCRYHNVCYINFKSGCRKPKKYSSPRKSKPRGRPEDKIREDAFTEVIKTLESNEVDMITLKECVTVMQDRLKNTSIRPFSITHMKTRLIHHYKHNITFTHEIGRGLSTVVILKTDASKILQSFYQEQRSGNDEEEKTRIISTASKLLLADILSIQTDMENYPDIDKLSDVNQQLHFLPQTLINFLKPFIRCKAKDLKIASIGQAIIQAARPRSVISPLQFGVAVTCHRTYASRTLVEILNQLGFCSSYKETCKFEANSAMSHGAQLKLNTNDIQREGQLQFIADNVDHNIRTLNGHGTFHGMGIMAVSTPKKPSKQHTARQQISLTQIKEMGKIDIFFYGSEWNGLSALKFTDIPDITFIDHTSQLDFIWTVSWPLRSPRPGWSGWMQTIATGEYPGVCDSHFLPLIDMNPSDMSCIYSTLCFICKEAQKYHITPIVTFDQPLFWKAQIITHSKNSDLDNIVLRLGMFHTLMSFLGCIGHIMEGCGLRDCLERVYASNTVSHILSGKAYSRAIRGHELLSAALHAILLSETYDIPWVLAHLRADESNEHQEVSADIQTSSVFDEEGVDAEDEYFRAIIEDNNFTSSFQDDPGQSEETYIEAEIRDINLSVGNEDLDALVEIIDGLMNGQTTAVNGESRASIQKVEQRINEHKTVLSNASRTTKLWINYLDMINLLKKAIAAERTGNFSMHLWAVKEMLPYFAACGHNFYAKSARLYLQKMTELESFKPNIFQAFTDGFHVFRRSERYWAGLSSDLMIEQVLMKNLKSSGGLTRGRGFGEAQQITWLLSAPACCEVIARMRQLTNLDITPDTTHKENTTCRKTRDHNDLRVLLTYILQRNPFCLNSDGIVSISTGRKADVSVTVDSAKEIGMDLVVSMTGKAVTEVTFKKKDQVKTMVSATVTKKEDDLVPIDPHLLFQRLITAGRNDSTKLHEYFNYELTSAPSALFDNSGLMRSCQKSDLSKCIWQPHYASDITAVEHIKYVVDGGSLLHKMPWQQNVRYQEIVGLYRNFIHNKYPGASVVFDGYACDTTTKDTAAIRRGLESCPDIEISPQAVLDVNKDRFLSNKHNKQTFIHLLSSHLETTGCVVRHAKSDADTLIVKTVLESAVSYDTALIAEDTDLLILLLHHVNEKHHTVLFASSPSKSSSKIWDIQKTQAELGKDFCENALFLHAFTGCDTTSHPYSIGKPSAVKKFQTNTMFKSAAKEFMNASNIDAVIMAGEKAMVALYGGIGGKLDDLRYFKYMQKVASNKSVVEPHHLPPTSAATKFHSMRAHHQVEVWKQLIDSTEIDPTSFGWEMIHGYLYPIFTDLPPAPQDLLKVIFCKCSTDCSTLRCSCRRHGLNCSALCLQCEGDKCSNLPMFSERRYSDLCSEEH